MEKIFQMTTFSTVNQDASELIYPVINRLPTTNRLDISPIYFSYSPFSKE